MSRQLVGRNPLHCVQLAGVRHVRGPGDHFARHVEESLSGGRVNALADDAPGRDRQGGLLEHFPDRGGLRALASLDLPAGQDPRRGAVIGMSAHQQAAAWWTMIATATASRSGWVMVAVGQIAVIPEDRSDNGGGLSMSAAGS
jgi:hypothetical protein